MKLQLLFIVKDLLTLLAYLIVYVHGKLRPFSKPKEIGMLVNLLVARSILWGRGPIRKLRICDRKAFMRIQKIFFPDQQALCAFPMERSNLAQAIEELEIRGRYPVIVLIGGEVDGQHADLTRRVIEMIAKTAQYMNAVVICGGTDMGVMAEIGWIRGKKRYKFPLVGIVPEQLVTWPSSPHSKKFSWWGNKRWQLESHYSHFILVPGSQFGDESPWITSAATLLSNGRQSITILINGRQLQGKLSN